MRLNLFPSGLIDEISCDADQVKIKREGLTKYKFSILKSEKIEFELWTTKKGKIEFDLDSVSYTHLTLPTIYSV